MLRKFWILAVALLATLLACSQKDRVQDADILSLSREGRGAVLIDGEAAAADGVDLKAVFFDYDRAFLRAEGRRVLETHAQWLRKHPKTLVQIEGSCDERGSENYNMQLGQRRAAAAKAYLISLGVEAERISVVSHGRLPGSQPRIRAQNRRGAFVVYYKD
jgi:outer membrane protein OmpA-like peptidoglycan-associated protein